MRLNKHTLLLILIFGFIAVIGCSSAASSLYDNENDSEDAIEEIESDDSNASSIQIMSLSDSYSSKSNSIPKVYSEIKKKVEAEVDLTKGFRIQIYSGQDVFEADTIASTFRAWSDTTIVGYQAETYTFFKTPYYRVHIGDFHNRDKAFNFSKMVKRLFKDAWVVYDTVDPYLVPKDTTEIKFQVLSE